MFNVALHAERIVRKPYVPTLTEENVRQGFFEQPEFDAVLARLPDWLRPPITFAYLTGWRLMSEILPLTWRQVDLEAGTVRLEVGSTKSGAGRVIYLPAFLIHTAVNFAAFFLRGLWSKDNTLWYMVWK
jgi:integrase